MKPPRARASVSFASITATILFTVSPLYQGDPTVPNRLRFCRGPQQPRPLIQRRRQWLVLWQRFLDVHGTPRLVCCATQINQLFSDRPCSAACKVAARARSQVWARVTPRRSQDARCRRA
jgi:hypothetical protein